MLLKNGLYLSVLLIIFSTNSLGQINRPKGPREYTDEYETRRIPHKVIVPIVDPLDIVPDLGTLEMIHTNNSHTNRTKPSRLAKKFNPFEHPDCAKCLSNKYLKHYYAKGCKPVTGEVICDNPCPKYFDCPKVETKITVRGCEYKGYLYRPRDRIEVDNPCKTGCFCDSTKDIKNNSIPTITCANVECFGDFSLNNNEKCYPFYEKDKCCSTRKECPNAQELQAMHKCLYDGKQYRKGERIYPKEDPCLTCICDENWNLRNFQNSSSCTKFNCDLELNSNLRMGCIPIYSEKSCCPIDYHCPLPKEHHCFFDGQKYSIGSKLDIGNNITECICRIPPDFTCVYGSHSGLERKVENISDEEYLNLTQQNPRIRTTRIQESPKLVNVKQTVRTNRVNHTRVETTTPSVIESELNTHSRTADKKILIRPAPGLRTKPETCPPEIPGGLACAGMNCTTILDSKGCQTCSCEKPCPDLECNDPCYVFAVTPGECPRCKCP